MDHGKEFQMAHIHSDMAVIQILISDLSSRSLLLTQLLGRVTGSYVLSALNKVYQTISFTACDV